MAVTQAFSGTETVTTTEHSMTTDTAGPDVDTTAGCYQAFLDLNALANGDVFEFRIYEKVLSSSTQRCVMKQTFAQAQGTDDAVWCSPPVLLIHGWDMTLKKVSGTDRAIDWSIRKAG
jgi:hypothetical protein